MDGALLMHDFAKIGCYKIVY